MYHPTVTPHAAVDVVPFFEFNRVLEIGGQSLPFIACFSLSDQVGIDVMVTVITIPETANRMSHVYH